ncbi:MAG: AbrB/MazE/SpoVT family DNA-binding domain-containing protein [Propionibacteriaceae bacterium]|nr:AbrB/MazE/SpoVT family DNA-binding domain-containing protein [Propionibacteriaceae bacterium]
MSVMYATVSTKGQVTIPAEVRDALHITPGRRVGFRMTETGVHLEVPATIEEVRSMLRTALTKNGTWGKVYGNGDGWAAYVEERYGQP